MFWSIKKETGQHLHREQKPKWESDAVNANVQSLPEPKLNVSIKNWSLELEVSIFTSYCNNLIVSSHLHLLHKLLLWSLNHLHITQSSLLISRLSLFPQLSCFHLWSLRHPRIHAQNCFPYHLPRESLSGNIPKMFQSDLRFIDLSDNLIKGSIPT